MRRLLLATLLALPLPALAQQAGTYRLQGTNPNGSSYSGTVELAAGGNGSWRVTWRIDNDVTEGVALVQGEVMAVGYLAAAQQPGVVAWRILPDGRLEGTWTFDGRIGRELLTPAGGGGK